ncbi:MAG: anthranilate phosphoribosyltransferase [Deltaproteobacteria bacterium]|nr:anthranilate phosphoribosyltransferase [Deltaproteobacteria bacterium]
MYSEEKLKEFGRVIGRLTAGGDLSREESLECYRQILLGEQPDLQQGAFLAAHIAKGPTTPEIAGCWEAVHRFDTQTIAPNLPEPACDIVGTGSDYLKTVNVSSPTAVIAAACGVYVAKKGAQRVTGVSGASEIFGAFGVDLASPLALAEKSLETCGLAYLPGESFLKAGWARLIQHMRFTSIFNIVGPLTMPCPAATTLVLGVYKRELARLMAEIAAQIGVTRALCLYGTSREHPAEQGIDEVSVCGATHCVELVEGKLTEYTLEPEDFGLKPSRYADVATKGDARGNALAALRVLAGRDEGPLADFLAANTAVVLKLTGKAASLPQGLDQARQALADGAALERLKTLVQTQHQDPGAGLSSLESLLSQVS